MRKRSSREWSRQRSGRASEFQREIRLTRRAANDFALQILRQLQTPLTVRTGDEIVHGSHRAEKASSSAS